MHAKENGWSGPVRGNVVYDHVLIRIRQHFLAYFNLQKGVVQVYVVSLLTKYSKYLCFSLFIITHIERGVEVIIPIHSNFVILFLFE